MKHSTSQKNARDWSPKVKRSHINFHKHHRPQQDVNTIPSTGEPVTVIAKVQQPSRPSSVSAQPTSYVVVDDQQPGTSRQMIFNPPSVVPSQQEEISTTLQDYPVSLELFLVCAIVSADRHTRAIFTLSTSTSTANSAIYHSS